MKDAPAPNVPDPQPIVRHAKCPNCGSKKFNAQKTTAPLADHGVAASVPIADRKCKHCGTVYHTLMPGWIGLISIALGLIAFFFLILDFAGELPGVGLTWFGRVLVPIVGILCLIVGVQLIIKKPASGGSNHGR